MEAISLWSIALAAEAREPRDEPLRNRKMWISYAYHRLTRIFQWFGYTQLRVKTVAPIVNLYWVVGQLRLGRGCHKRSQCKECCNVLVFETLERRKTDVDRISKIQWISKTSATLQRLANKKPIHEVGGGGGSRYFKIFAGLPPMTTLSGITPFTCKDLTCVLCTWQRMEAHTTAPAAIVTPSKKRLDKPTIRWPKKHNVTISYSAWSYYGYIPTNPYLEYNQSNAWYLIFEIQVHHRQSRGKNKHIMLP